MSADTTSGRQIAESMMDRAEARYRHEHGQPHRRDRCEDCAVQAVVDAVRPVHYQEAAASLRRLGHDAAADLLDSVARDLTDELSTTDTEGAR